MVVLWVASGEALSPEAGEANSVVGSLILECTSTGQSSLTSSQCACVGRERLCTSKSCPWSAQVSYAAGTGACVGTLHSTTPSIPEPGLSISFLARMSPSPVARSHPSYPMTTRTAACL